MDPFSILSAVVTGGKTLFAITKSILGFVDEVRTINQLIQGIYYEVDSLRQTLGLINYSLASSLLLNTMARSQVTRAMWRRSSNLSRIANSLSINYTTS